MRILFNLQKKILSYRSGFKVGDLADVIQPLCRCFLGFLLCSFCILPGVAWADSTQPSQPSTATRPLITQEIRYHWAEAGEVFLVWGMNESWDILPEADRPPGTVIIKKAMYTPMHPSNGYFSTQIKVPPDTTLKYLFRIPRTAKGDHVELWDSNYKTIYQTVVKSEGVIDVQGTLMREPAYTLIFDILLLLLLLGISFSFVFPAHLQAGIRQLAQKFQVKLEGFKKLRLREDQAIAIGLTILILLGLALRLWVAGHTNLRLPNAAADRLIGDEMGYEGLGNDVRFGVFFTWPGRTPAYPLFITLCYLIFGHRSPALLLYAQAFLGASAIPLTFLLARRFTGAWYALLAAGLIAIHPSLILHTTRLYAEILYVPFLLLVLLLLLQAIKTGKIKDFALLGGMVAAANLCRPAMMLFFVALPLLMPWGWTLKRKISCFLAYMMALVVVTAPWTYHNYLNHKKFLPYSVSTGVLWLGSPEYYHLSSQEKRGSLDVWNEQLNPAKNGGYDPYTIEGDRYFKQRAIASIKAEPGIYAWYCLQKVAYFWLGNPKDWAYHAIHSVDGLRDFYSKYRIVGIFAARLMPLVALAGLFVVRHRWLEFWPLLIVCAYFTGIHSLTYAQVRFSEPLHPILATIIAVAVSESLSRFRHRVNYDLAVQ